MWNIYIYGTNNYPPPSDGSYPLRSTITGQSDVVAFNVQAIGGNIVPKIEGDTVKYIDYTQDFIGTYFFSFDLQFVQNFPGQNTTPEDLWGLPVFKKRYKYLWLNDYPIKPSKLNNEDRVIPIIITGISVENQKGFKKIQFIIEEVNGN